MSSLEELLAAWRTGGPAAADAVLVELYPILHARVKRALRSERNRDILQTTDLLHDLYIKLRTIKTPPTEGPTHFMRTAEAVVRNMLVDLARTRRSQKGGQSPHFVTLSRADLSADPSIEQRVLDVVMVHKALGRINQYDSDMAVHIGLRLFFEMTQNEVAEALGKSRSTIQREWTLARRALLRELGVVPSKDTTNV